MQYGQSSEYRLLYLVLPTREDTLPAVDEEQEPTISQVLQQLAGLLRGQGTAPHVRHQPSLASIVSAAELQLRDNRPSQRDRHELQTLVAILRALDAGEIEDATNQGLEMTTLLVTATSHTALVACACARRL